jgi:hypothetical protein
VITMPAGLVRARFAAIAAPLPAFHGT